MRKINELTADEFLDAFYAISPLIPAILGTDMIRMRMFGQLNDKMKDAGMRLADEKRKKEQDAQAVENVNKELVNQSVDMLINDMAKIVPVLISKDNRGAVYELLSILEQRSVDEIRKYTPPKLIARIKQVISDTDIQSFLAFAEPSEQIE